MKLTKIYCGRSRQDGTLVRHDDILRFLKTEVATQYEAFTVTYTTGYWNGVPVESFVIEVITKPVSHHVDFRPKQVANAYKKDFDQQAVMITVQSLDSTLI